MAKSADEKRSKILDVAKRRFAHYGLAKTTMAEIAKDLGLSKALLYYYFPDKNNLYIAVIEGIVDEMHTELRVSLTDELTLEESIFVFLERRKEFLRKYFYILEYVFSFQKDLSSETDHVFMKAYAEEVKLLKTILQKGIDSSELCEMDIEENANIFLNACFGMRMVIMKNLKNLFVFDKDDFDSILSVEKKFAIIFINGLKKK